MKRFLFLACAMVSISASAAVSPDLESSSHLTAAQVVDKNVEARGGLKAWHDVKTLAFSGLLEAGGTKNSELPFVLKMKRDRKSRLEVKFQDQTALQIYDGEHGWKVRPFLGRNEVEPFTPAEAKAASAWQDLDGPLMDYAKKGTKIDLEGMESVEGHNTYKLRLTMKDGNERHVWIDAKSFLERKIDGDPRRLDGRMRNVAVYYHDYKTEHGLTIPTVMETVVEGGKLPHKMYIEHLLVNQTMADALFAKPKLTESQASAQASTSQASTSQAPSQQAELTP